MRYFEINIQVRLDVILPVYYYFYIVLTALHHEKHIHNHNIGTVTHCSNGAKGNTYKR